MSKRSTFIALILSALALFAASAFAQNFPAYLLYQKNGAAANDQLGISVVLVGDLNGDGKDDFIIGAHGADPGGIIDAGSAYVYSGADGAFLYQKNGSAAGDFLGFAVAGAGDVNGDGKSDFIVGAFAASPGGLLNAGSAYVYSGANGALLYQKDGGAAGDNFGIHVASAGDVNGDNLDDFMVGAFGADPGGILDAGSAYVYSGATGGLLYLKSGTAIGDLFGNVIASAGDVNGDARDDFIVGAFQADPGGLTNAGSAYVYSGATGALLYQKNGSAANDALGSHASGAGDLNGDGRDDFIIAAWDADPGGILDAGSVYVYSGATGALLLQKNGAAVGDHFGTRAEAADVNGDGRPDILVTAMFADPGGLGDAGSAYVYSGADGSFLLQKNGAAPGDQFGRSLGSNGDVDGDGRLDFIIGAFTADPGGLGDAGSAFVYHSGYNEDILSVTDVGNDQGKKVRVQWKSLPANDNFVKEFALYRRVDGALSAGGNNLFNLTSSPPGTWDFVATVPARGDTTYSVVVPTLQDSTVANGMHWSVFYVAALGDNPTEHFDSPIDSGYSLDNLFPSAPNLLAAIGTCQATVELAYSSPGDADLSHFKIYRSTSSEFSEAELVGTTSENSFAAAAPSGQTLFYRVTAVDSSGNESPASSSSSAQAGLKGDLDADGQLTPTDVVQELNAIFLNASFSAPSCAADLDCSGGLSSSDVVLILSAVFLGTPVTCTP